MELLLSNSKVPMFLTLLQLTLLCCSLNLVASQTLDHHHAKYSSALNELSYIANQGEQLISTIINQDTNNDNNDFVSTQGISSSPAKAVIFNPTTCSTDFPDLKSEIQNYKSVVDQILFASLNGSYKGTTYNKLAYFVDTYANRLSGSDGLEASIDFLQKEMSDLGFENVRTEKVPNVPAWKRGLEEATLLTPKRKNLAIIGLGSSASTSIFGITSEVVVFNSYAELVANKTQARNKIVVCNFGGPATAPLDTVNNGYAEAVSSGARAMLYRSATSFSLYSPHARRANLYYDNVNPKVPIAYLTLEDADLLSRISARGQSISVHLKMLSFNATRTSRNLFGDLTGSKNPDEFVLLASHTDNWDVGQGAQDDGFAIYLALQGMSLLKSLNFIPKRTIRAALWTSEEYGYLGSQKYIQDHFNEFSNLNIALEADYGCLSSTGLIFNGRKKIGCILNEIISLIYQSKATLGLLVQANTYKSDLDNFEDAGVPVVSLNGDDGRYFYFHHTHADTMTAVNSGVLDKCLATWTTTAYILADLNERIPIGFDEY